jgi:hypothetical protein
VLDKSIPVAVGGRDLGSDYYLVSGDIFQGPAEGFFAPPIVINFSGVKVVDSQSNGLPDNGIDFSLIYSAPVLSSAERPAPQP